MKVIRERVVTTLLDVSWAIHSSKCFVRVRAHFHILVLYYRDVYSISSSYIALQLNHRTSVAGRFVLSFERTSSVISRKLHCVLEVDISSGVQTGLKPE